MLINSRQVHDPEQTRNGRVGIAFSRAAQNSWPPPQGRGPGCRADCLGVARRRRSIQHAADHRRAARDLYRVQVLTTVSRFIDEETRQIALPVAQRSAVAFGDLAGSINADLGVNGAGTLNVSLGAGSVAPFTQIAFRPR